MKSKTHLAIIGYGKLAKTMLPGFLKMDTFSIRISSPTLLAKHDCTLAQVQCFQRNSEAIKEAHIILLAVKPYQLKQVLIEIAPHLTIGQLVVSVAAGVQLEQIQHWLPSNMPIVRAMPNTAAMIQQSTTAMIANEKITEQQKNLITALFEHIGSCHWLRDESHMDVATALAGSGPAFVYAFVEALEAASIQLGFPLHLAGQFAKHTVHAASLMALESPLSLLELKAQVTSKGGTTEAGLQALSAHGFNKVVALAVESAVKRAQQLHNHESN